MKVIGAGFGRTGTASQKEALEMLGLGPCYHMREVFEHPDHVPFWERASLGEKVDFAEFFREWPSTVDWPGCTFYRELMEIYPNAKVLLSVRDPDRWYQSCRATIYPATSGQRMAPPSGAPSADIVPSRFALAGGFINQLIWQNTFKGRFEDRDFAIGVYNRHNAEVRASVPSDRLLVFDVKEGWGPLCEFFGVEAPEQPFPHLNDTASFLERSGGPPPQ
jgi:hypothetical protein